MFADLYELLKLLPEIVDYVQAYFADKVERLREGLF